MAIKDDGSPIKIGDTTRDPEPREKQIHILHSAFREAGGDLLIQKSTWKATTLKVDNSTPEALTAPWQLDLNDEISLSSKEGKTIRISHLNGRDLCSVNDNDYPDKTAIQLAIGSRQIENGTLVFLGPEPKAMKLNVNNGSKLQIIFEKR